MRAAKAFGQRGETKRQRAPRSTVSSEGALCGLADNGGRREASGGWHLCPGGLWNEPKAAASLALAPQPGGKSRGGVLPIDSCRDDPARVARPFACGVEPLVGEVAVVLVARDTHGG